MLDVNRFGALWNLVLFAALLIVLGKFVWPTILKGLIDREQRMRNDLESAEQANAKAQQTLSDYQRKLTEAHNEARQVVDQARADGEQLRRKFQAETEQEIATMRQQAKAEIERARAEAVQQLYALAGQLAVVVAEKILQRQINEQDTQQLIDQSLRQIDQLDETG